MALLKISLTKEQARALVYCLNVGEEELCKGIEHFAISIRAIRANLLVQGGPELEVIEK